jgi:hypothetical protein
MAALPALLLPGKLFNKILCTGAKKLRLFVLNDMIVNPTINKHKKRRSDD